MCVRVSLSVSTTLRLCSFFFFFSELPSFCSSCFSFLPSFFLTGSLIRVSDEFLAARFHSSSRLARKLRRPSFQTESGILASCLEEYGMDKPVNRIVNPLTWREREREICGNIILFNIVFDSKYFSFLFFISVIELNFVNVARTEGGESFVRIESLTDRWEIFRKLCYTKITIFQIHLSFALYIYLTSGVCEHCIISLRVS